MRAKEWKSWRDHYEVAVSIKSDARNNSSIIVLNLLFCLNTKEMTSADLGVFHSLLVFIAAQ